MKVYDNKSIRNVILLGGPKSGKTILAESMLFKGGVIKRKGTIEDKSTVSDFHEVEHERGNSVSATSMHTEWKDYKINILDTPGSDDFVGEVSSSIRVADTCLFTINAQHGLEVATEIIWNNVEKLGKATAFVVNQLDHSKSQFDQAVESLQTRFSNAALMQYPLNEGEDFDTIIDVLDMCMYKYSADGAKVEKLDIPDDEKEKAESLHSELVEKIAENDEELMEIYFEKGQLSDDELRKGLKIGMINGMIYPIFCVSAKLDIGVDHLLDFIGSSMPAPCEVASEKTTSGEDISCDPNAPILLFVFKTLVDPYFGKLTFFKVVSGTLTPGVDLVNAQTSETERFNQFYIMDGKNRNNVDTLCAGDIGSAVKLKNTATNQTLRAKNLNIEIKPIDFPTPRIQLAIVAENKNDDEKLVTVLRGLQQEDPTLHVEYSKELKQLIITGQGELHLELAKWKIEQFHKIKATFIRPKIPYRETIQTEATANYRHKKQSGGAGQFGEVHMKVLPFVEGMADPEGLNIRKKEVYDLPWGGKLVFYNCIVGGVIDARYIPSILKGIMEKMEEGPITGSYARDICVMVYDGKMHPVDSNDISFKIAGAMAFKDAFLKAKPLLLEPIYEMEVLAPEDLVGDIMSDLQTRRSMILGIDAKSNYQVVKSKTPLAELYKYSTSLKSITQGRAGFSTKFHEYSQVPGEIQNKLAEEYAKQQES